MSVAAVPESDRGDPRHLLQHAFHGGRIEDAVAPGNLHQNRLTSARALLQVLHRIGRHQLAAIDDDDLFACLLDFGQNVRAQHDRVITSEAANQVTCFVDLLGIQSRGGLVEDQHVRVVNDGLGQADALPVAFG